MSPEVGTYILRTGAFLTFNEVMLQGSSWLSSGEFVGFSGKEGLAQALAIGSSFLGGAGLKEHPWIASTGIGMSLSPIVTTLLGSERSKEDLLPLLAKNYTNPWNYIRGGIIGFSLGYGFNSGPLGAQVNKAEEYTLLRGMGKTPLEISEIFSSEASSIMKQRFILGGLTGIASGPVVDLIKGAVENGNWDFAKFAKDASLYFVVCGLAGVFVGNQGKNIVNSLRSFADLGLPQETSVFGISFGKATGATLLYNQAAAGAIEWVIVSPAFTLGKAVFGSIFGNKNENLDNLTLEKLLESALSGPRSGLWMKPMIGIFQTADKTAPTWYNQGGFEKVINAAREIKYIFTKGSEQGASAFRMWSWESMQSASWLVKTARWVDSSVFFMPAVVTLADTVVSKFNVSNEMKSVMSWLPFFMVPNFSPDASSALLARISSDRTSGKFTEEGFKKFEDRLRVLENYKGGMNDIIRLPEIIADGMADWTGANDQASRQQFADAARRYIETGDVNSLVEVAALKRSLENPTVNPGEVNRTEIASSLALDLGLNSAAAASARDIREAYANFAKFDSIDVSLRVFTKTDSPEVTFKGENTVLLENVNIAAPDGNGTVKMDVRVSATDLGMLALNFINVDRTNGKFDPQRIAASLAKHFGVEVSDAMLNAARDIVVNGSLSEGTLNLLRDFLSKKGINDGVDAKIQDFLKDNNPYNNFTLDVNGKSEKVELADTGRKVISQLVGEYIKDQATADAAAEVSASLPVKADRDAERSYWEARSAYDAAFLGGRSNQELAKIYGKARALVSGFVDSIYNRNVGTYTSNGIDRDSLVNAVSKASSAGELVEFLTSNKIDKGAAEKMAEEGEFFVQILPADQSAADTAKASTVKQ